MQLNSTKHLHVSPIIFADLPSRLLAHVLRLADSAQSAQTSIFIPRFRSIPSSRVESTADIYKMHASNICTNTVTVYFVLNSFDLGLLFFWM